jgi:hypothetical protein
MNYGAALMWPSRTYFTILADPPWEQPMAGKCRRYSAPQRLSYPTHDNRRNQGARCGVPCGRGLSLYGYGQHERLLARYDVMDACSLYSNSP